MTIYTDILQNYKTTLIYWRELPWTNSGRSNSSSSSSLSSPSLSSRPPPASHQLLDLALFAPSCSLIPHLLLKRKEVSYIRLGGFALLEDGHDFVEIGRAHV